MFQTYYIAKTLNKPTKVQIGVIKVYLLRVRVYGCEKIPLEKQKQKAMNAQTSKSI